MDGINAPFSDETSLRFGTPQIFAPPLQLPVATMLEQGEKRTVEIGRVSPICEPSRTVFLRSLKTLRRTSRIRGRGRAASARCCRSRRWASGSEKRAIFRRAASSSSGRGGSVKNSSCGCAMMVVRARPDS